MIKNFANQPAGMISKMQGASVSPISLTAAHESVPKSSSDSGLYLNTLCVEFEEDRDEEARLH